MKRSEATALMLAIALLAGCGRGGNEAGVGGVSADEAAQRNNAAEMLDASADGLAAPTDQPVESNVGEEAAAGNAVGS